MYKSGPELHLTHAIRGKNLLVQIGELLFRQMADQDNTEGILRSDELRTGTRND